MKKTVTFSIPIYNIPKEQIKQCLDSVIEITKDNKDVEAFVVENASTDKTI
jgi:glycosyltransferase involved in cell wall biosynthesis